MTKYLHDVTRSLESSSFSLLLYRSENQQEETIINVSTWETDPLPPEWCSSAAIIWKKKKKWCEVLSKTASFLGKPFSSSEASAIKVCFLFFFFF